METIAPGTTVSAAQAMGNSTGAGLSTTPPGTTTAPGEAPSTVSGFSAGGPTSANANTQQGVPHGNANPTFAGQVVRTFLKGGLSTLLSLAAPVANAINGKPEGITVHSGYLGDVSDLATEIQNNSAQLAQQIQSGKISLIHGLLSSVANSALTTANATLPFEGVGAVADAAIPATAEELAEQAAKPALSTAERAAQLATTTAKSAATGYGYDIAGNTANPDNTTPGSILKPGVGTAIGALVPGAGEVLGKTLDLARAPSSTFAEKFANIPTEERVKGVFGEDATTPEGKGKLLQDVDNAQQNSNDVKSGKKGAVIPTIPKGNEVANDIHTTISGKGGLMEQAAAKTDKAMAIIGKVKTDYVPDIIKEADDIKTVGANPSEENKITNFRNELSGLKDASVEKVDEFITKYQREASKEGLFKDSALNKTRTDYQTLRDTTVQKLNAATKDFANKTETSFGMTDHPYAESNDAWHRAFSAQETLNDIAGKRSVTGNYSKASSFLRNSLEGGDKSIPYNDLYQLTGHDVASKALIPTILEDVAEGKGLGNPSVGMNPITTILRNSIRGISAARLNPDLIANALRDIIKKVPLK